MSEHNQEINTMNKIWRVFVAFVSLASAGLSFAQQYQCTPISTLGFAYNSTTQKWEPVSIEGKSYIFQPSELEGYLYELNEVGQHYKPAVCTEEFTSMGYINCSNPHMGGEFRFNRITGRYVLTQVQGYYNVLPSNQLIPDELSAKPYVEIGVCQITFR